MTVTEMPDPRAWRLLLLPCLIGLGVLAPGSGPQSSVAATPAVQQHKAARLPGAGMKVTRLGGDRQAIGHLKYAVDEGDFCQTPTGKRRLLRLAGTVALRAPSSEGADLLMAEMAGAQAPLNGYAAKKRSGGWVVFTAPPAERDEQLKIKGRHAETLAWLRGQRGEAVNPVFVDPVSGLWLLARGETIVCLKKGVDPRDYFGAQWPSVRPLPGTSDQFIVALGQPEAEQALEEANTRAADPRVVWAEPHFLSEVRRHYTPNDSAYATQWHLNNTGASGVTADADVDAPEAWNLTRGSAQTVVAILDDGVQISHPDLAANIFANTADPKNGADNDGNGYADDYNGWNFVSGNNNAGPIDVEDNHGTSCAGVAAAVGDNGIGGAGIAFGCRILPVKVIEGDASCTGETMANAVRYAAGLTSPNNWRGADVLSMSFTSSRSSVLDSALTDAATSGRGGKGCPLFCATGNRASGWYSIAFSVAAGTHTYRWQYEKDGYDSDGADTAWLDAITFPDGTREGFESGGIPGGWTTGGNAPWYSVQDGVAGNHALTGWGGPGSRALRAGAISHNQSTYLQVTKYNPTRAEISFYFWVSCEEEPYDPYEWFDFGSFYIDNVLQGQVDTEASVTVDPGYPASHIDAIGVGACTDFGFRSEYSQYGLECDFVTPSSGGAFGIYTTDRTGSAGYSTGDYDPTFGGTSSSTPLAAGIAALVLSRNPTLTGAQVRALLHKSCDKIGGQAYSGGEAGAGGRNNPYGYGRLNAFRALSNTVVNLMLVVDTPRGAPTPPAGTNWFISGTTRSASVAVSPVVSGTTQYVCRGWVGTGSAPESGASTNTGGFMLLANSSVAWLWGTNYWLDVGATGQGSLSTGDRWLAADTNLQITATPTSHWHFAAWSGNTNGCTIASNRLTAVMRNSRAITAGFAIDRHKLRIVSAWGTPEPAVGLHTNDYGSVLTNNVFVWDTRGTTQYVCTGWTVISNTPPNGTNTKVVLTLTNNAVLTWQWGLTNYWLEVAAGGSGSVNRASGWCMRGSNVQMTATALNHYRLLRWTGQTNGCTTVGNSITAPMTVPRAITANFALAQHPLVVTTPYGKSRPSAGTNWVEYSMSTNVAVTNSPVSIGTTQYVCRGWTGTGSVPASGTTTNTGSFVMTNDSSLAWLWRTNFWLDTGSGGNGTVNVPDGWFAAGTNVEVMASPSNHYHFTQWTGTGVPAGQATNNPLSLPMDRVRVVVANFAIDQHSLFMATPYGKGNPAAGTNWYNYNTSVRALLTNSPVTAATTQYVCRGWTGSGSTPAAGATTNTGFFLLTNDSAIAWLWSTNYWLDTGAAGGGSVTVADGWKTLGSNVVITAVPSNHFHFVEWSGQTNDGVIVSNRITVGMDAPRTLTANFVIDQHSLLVSTPHGIGNPPAGTNSYAYNTSVRAGITNSPLVNDATQYVCRGWTGTGSVPATGTTTNTGAFSLTTNSTVTWLWKTNFWLDVGHTGLGKLSTGDCWRASGSNVQVTATASNHWHFSGWTGQTNGCTMVSNKITIVMDGPRAVAGEFAKDQHKLTVTTRYGQATPAPGTNWFEYGSSNSVAITNSPVTEGGTQYVCRGWTGTGSVPASGATTNTPLFALTADSTIVWNWRTNTWLHVDKTGQGTLSTNDAWFGLGSNIQVTATAATYFVFGSWQGQTNGCTLASNRITVVMNSARTLEVVFKANLATNNVPQWWLAHYGLTNLNVDALRDVDHDGMLTWEEWVAGCDPTNKASVFRFASAGGAPGQGNVIRWPSISNRFYGLTRSTNLVLGTNGFLVLPGASNMPATPAMNSYTDDVQGVGPYFYRINVRE